MLTPQWKQSRALMSGRLWCGIGGVPRGPLPVWTAGDLRQGTRRGRQGALCPPPTWLPGSRTEGHCPQRRPVRAGPAPSRWRLCPGAALGNVKCARPTAAGILVEERGAVRWQRERFALEARVTVGDNEDSVCGRPGPVTNGARVGVSARGLRVGRGRRVNRQIALEE